MKRTVLLFLLLIASVLPLEATVIGGTFKYPDGSLVTGVLTIQLTKPGILNTCSSPFVIVPTTAVRIPVVTGVIQGSPDFVPNDCMNKFQPYKVQLYDGARKLLFTQWWVVVAKGGALTVPPLGSSYISPTGLNVSVLGPFNPLIWQIAENLAGFRTATVSVSIPGTSSVTATASWNTSFASGTYIPVCSYIDGTNPTTASVYPTALSALTSVSVQVTLRNDGSNAANGKLVCHGRAS